MRNRAVVERAKGILMERHDIAEQDAYEMLRRHARDERQSLLSTAEAVLRARPLLPIGPSATTRLDEHAGPVAQRRISTLAGRGGAT